MKSKLDQKAFVIQINTISVFDRLYDVCLLYTSVKTVCVTSSVVSSLAVLCDYCILLKRWLGPLGGGSMIGQITQMYIADLLSTRTGMIDQKTTLKAKETTFDYIIDKMRKERI